MELNAAQLSRKENYKLITGVLVPRPIAFVSTIGADGVYNVAPFSFFNAVSSQPPIVMFSIHKLTNGKKDTLANIEQNPEFVVNMVSEEIMNQMNDASADFKPEISEFSETGLTPVKAEAINGVGVLESLVRLECQLEKLMDIGNCTMVFGRIVHYHIDDRVWLGNYKVDQTKLQPVARMGGIDYALIREICSLEKHFDPAKVAKRD